MEKIACVFPGQGAQFVGMGKALHHEFVVARHTYEEASEAAGYDIAGLCFNGPPIQQMRADKMQMAIVITEVAMFRTYMHLYGVNPQFLAGHSVGEYAALICSGAVSLSFAVRILLSRGELLLESVRNGQGYMSIVEEIDEARLRDILDGDPLVFISCLNAPEQYSISGKPDPLRQAELRLRADKAKVTPMENSPPIHSPLMLPQAVRFEQILRELPWMEMRIPVISNVTGLPFSDSSLIPELMSRQLVSPVRWRESVRLMDYYGVTLCLEIGPKSLLTSLFGSNGCRFPTFCFGVREERERIKRFFDDSECLKRDRIHFLDRCLGIAVSTPNRNDNTEEYRRGVISNYNAIKARGTDEKPLDDREKRELTVRLIEILKTKKLSTGEINQWLWQLFDETGAYYELRDLLYDEVKG